MQREAHRTNIFPLFLVFLAVPALSIAHIFGLLPIVGIVLFLCASVLIIIFKKTYHALVLTGICLLFCVFIEPAPSDVLFCAALPLGLVAGVYRPRLYGMSFKITLLFAAYFISCLPGIVFALDFGGAIRYYAITLYLFGIAFFIATYARKNNIKSMLRAYIMAGFLSFLVGLAGYLGFFSSLLMADSFRVRGLFKDPNVFGPFFVPAILLVVDDFKKRTLIKSGLFMHLFLTVTMTLGAIFSFSRGAWINLFITLFVYYFLKGDLLKFLKPKRLIPVILVVAVALLILSLPFMEKSGISAFLSDRAKLQDYDSNRFTAQEGGLKMLLENPLGCGPGQFESNIANITKAQLSAHSLFVRVGAENGVAGFIFFFGALIYLMISLFRYHRQLLKLRKDKINAAAWSAYPTIKATISSDTNEISLQQAKKSDSLHTKTVDLEETQSGGISLIVTISILCGLLVSSLAVDTLHWRSFWFFIGIGLYQLNKKNRAAQPADKNI